MLSIVLPCYNPPNDWVQNMLTSFSTIENAIKEPIELIVVNDGSQDKIEHGIIDTIRLHIPEFRYIEYAENKGKGYAIRQGMKEAKGDVLIYTDIDFPYTCESLINIYSRLQNTACDIAIGVKGTAYYDSVPFLRKSISKFLRYLIRNFLDLPFTDTQCGLKGFKRTALPVFLSTTINRYLFDLEFVKTAYSKTNFKIEAIPVELNAGVVFRKMNYKILVPEMFNFIKLSFRKEK